MSNELTVTQDGEVLEGQVLEAPVTLFGTNDPVAVVERASTVATALAEVIKKRKLTSRISGKEHVQVEGWTLLGSMLGVFAEVEWSKPTDNGWEARAIARTLGGQVVGAADAMCTRGESSWSRRDEYAIRSMAQTRAVSKALRLPLGFIMHLAGYSATPAEELTDEQPGRGEQVQPKMEPGPRQSSGGATPATTPAPTDDQIRHRYQYGLQNGWPDDDSIDAAAIESTGKTPMEMDPDTWKVFAVSVLKDGPRTEQPEPAATPPGDAAPAIPPKPGTDEYKALPDGNARAEARKYWAEQADIKTREPERLRVTA